MESVLNATSLDVNFTDVNNALLDAVIDLSKYQWLLDWEASRMVPVRDGASIMIEDFLYLATGYCTGNNAVTCQVTQDCTDGGTTGLYLLHVPVHNYIKLCCLVLLLDLTRLVLFHV